MEQKISRLDELKGYVFEVLEGSNCEELFSDTAIENAYDRAPGFMNLWSLALRIADRLICRYQLSEEEMQYI